MKKIISLILCSVLLITSILAVTPATDADVTVSAPSAVLMHPSGEVIYQKNANVKMEPASVTKVMTLLLIMEEIEAGSLAYEDMVIGSAYAASMGGSQIWLKEGETFSVDDMIKCIAVVSANDCSVAMAEHIAGSEAAFVARMNKRAQELGMYDTNFENCNGLPSENHYTTAYDIALMSAELIKHEKILEYTSIWMDTIRGGAFGLDNTNKMLKSYKGMLGLKTGYTKTAGSCLSGVAERDGMKLIAVVMKAADNTARNNDVAALLNYGFANYAEAILSPDVPLMPVKVNLGKRDAVAIELSRNDNLLIEKSKLTGLEKTVELPEEISAPIKAGDAIGSFLVYSDGELVLDVPIVAAEDVEKMGIFDIWALVIRKAFIR